MRGIAVCLVVAAAAAGGCQNFLVRTQNRVAFDAPIDTRVTADLPPVSPTAGPVRPVVVRPGAGPRVAVVDVDGVVFNYPFVGPSSVGENPVAVFREKLDAAAADPAVAAVVLRVNSPGGGVAACQQLRRDLERFKARCRKPVAAALGDTACGGAYVLASAADAVLAAPGSTVGGVGVTLNLYNLRDLMAQFNVLPQTVKAGKFADLGTVARRLEDDEKAVLQAMADEFYEQLKADVRRSRPRADPAALDGRVVTGPKAVSLGLADRVGDLDDAVDAAAGLAGCPPGGSEVVLYRRANDPAHTLYAVTANVPLQGAGLLPNIPGLDRTKLPTFVCMWQPDPTADKLGGR